MRHPRWVTELQHSAIRLRARSRAPPPCLICPRSLGSMFLNWGVMRSSPRAVGADGWELKVLVERRPTTPRRMPAASLSSREERVSSSIPVTSRALRRNTRSRWRLCSREDAREGTVFNVRATMPCPTRGRRPICGRSRSTPRPPISLQRETRPPLALASAGRWLARRDRARPGRAGEKGGCRHLVLSTWLSDRTAARRPWISHPRQAQRHGGPDRRPETAGCCRFTALKGPIPWKRTTWVFGTSGVQWFRVAWPYVFVEDQPRLTILLPCDQTQPFRKSPSIAQARPFPSKCRQRHWSSFATTRASGKRWRSREQGAGSNGRRAEGCPH